MQSDSLNPDHLTTNSQFSMDWFGTSLQAEETLRIPLSYLTVDLNVIVQAFHLEALVNILQAL